MAYNKEQLEEINKSRAKSREYEEQLNQAKAELSKEWKKSKWENRKQKQGKGPRDYDKIISSQQEKSNIKTKLTSLYKHIYKQKQQVSKE